LAESGGVSGWGTFRPGPVEGREGSGCDWLAG
jgi:hypothetical protein